MAGHVCSPRSIGVPLLFFLFFYCTVHLLPLTGHAYSLLTNDHSTTSSALTSVPDTSGWPRLRQQPPGQVIFYNQTGAVIACSFTGSPAPIVYWTVSSAQPGYESNSAHAFDHIPLPGPTTNHLVHPIAGPSSGPAGHLSAHDASRWPPLSPSSSLRYVRADGALVFSPFATSDYDDSIHNRRYRCVGVNQHGALLSREVHVKARE